jgi:hypothetical protein
MHPGGGQMHYSDQLTQESVENTGVVLSVPKHVRFARYISTIFSPPAISISMIILIALDHMSSLTAALLYATITLFFLSCGPWPIYLTLDA